MRVDGVEMSDEQRLSVNGASIERSYLRAMVEDARSVAWSPSECGHEHVHCSVCGLAVTRGSPLLRAGTAYLCPSCHERFVAADPIEIV